jgi:hypothetical protein
VERRGGQKVVGVDERRVGAVDGHGQYMVRMRGHYWWREQEEGR